MLVACYMALLSEVWLGLLIEKTVLVMWVTRDRLDLLGILRENSIYYLLVGAIDVGLSEFSVNILLSADSYLAYFLYRLIDCMEYGDERTCLM